MKTPTKLSISRKTLVPFGAKQSKVQGGGAPEIKTTSICPFICE
jgi:hypothetical protein